MLSNDKYFKEAIEYAILNYDKMEMVYKCAYTDEVGFPIKKTIQIFKEKLKKVIHLNLFTQIGIDVKGMPYCKIVLFTPSIYVDNIALDIVYRQEKKEFTIPDLITHFWLESVNSLKVHKLFNADELVSHNFVSKSNVCSAEEDFSAFDIFLPSKEDAKRHTDKIMALFLHSIGKFNNDRIDLLHYNFLIPGELDHANFLFEFDKLLKYAFDCETLFNIDIKSGKQNRYELIIAFPLINGFSTSNLDVQHLVKAMWVQLLNKSKVHNLKNLFLLELNFGMYDINADIGKNNFSLGLYRLNRKISAIHNAITDENYKNLIIQCFR